MGVNLIAGFDLRLYPRLLTLAVSVFVILALAGVLHVRKRRRISAERKQLVGPEYERAVPKGMVETVGISSDSCTKIKDLGFKASLRVKMYGERFDIVSDPFKEGDCIAVRATTGSNPEIRTVLLPIAILLGIADRFLKRPT